MIQDENDKPGMPKVAYIFEGFLHVNLIPLNENMHSSRKRSRIQVINKFKSVLSAGISVTRRREMGPTFRSCGQLKASFLNGTRFQNRGN